jgi:hypothetical protein
MNGDEQSLHYHSLLSCFILFVPLSIPRSFLVHINYCLLVVSTFHQTSINFCTSTLVQSLLFNVSSYFRNLLCKYGINCVGPLSGIVLFRFCHFFCVIENIHQKTNSGPLFLSFNCSQSQASYSGSFYNIKMSILPKN